MFLGHFAVAYGAKRFAPRTSLGMLFLGVQAPDILFPIFALLGLEKVEIAPGDTVFTPMRFLSYPFSHSLVADVVWAVVLGGVYYAVRRYGPGAVALGCGVLSHWVLDVVTHRPDMPLLFDSGPKLGLGLWNSREGTLLVELAMFAVGVALYVAATQAKDRVGRVASWALIAFLVVVYLASAFGPPPPSVAAMAWAGLAGWLILLWAFWADAHRAPRSTAGGTEPAR